MIRSQNREMLTQISMNALYVQYTALDSWCLVLHSLFTIYQSHERSPPPRFISFTLIRVTGRIWHACTYTIVIVSEQCLVEFPAVVSFNCHRQSFEVFFSIICKSPFAPVFPVWIVPKQENPPQIFLRQLARVQQFDWLII